MPLYATFLGVRMVPSIHPPSSLLPLSCRNAMVRLYKALTRVGGALTSSPMQIASFMAQTGSPLSCCNTSHADRLFHGANWIASFMLQCLPCKSPLSYCNASHADPLFHGANRIASFMLQTFIGV
jgi:hypothetical protein